LIAPVIVGDRVVGTLDVEDERTDALSDGDRRLFERVAGEMRPLYTCHGIHEKESLKRQVLRTERPQAL
jgi:hypothetical protein